MTNTQNRREYLQALLSAIPGVKAAYFQPGRSVTLKYPCIVYKFAGEKDLRADDIQYNSRRYYDTVVIDPNPDSVIPDILHKNFTMSSLQRVYTSDNLNHWAYRIFF